MTTKKQKDEFLSDIIEVYKKHGLAISHEDSHGGFLIKNYSDDFVQWLQAACYYHERKKYSRRDTILNELDERFTDDGEWIR